MEIEKPSPEPKAPAPLYSALTAPRRRVILTLITVAGFFGPLAGNIYLPALPTLAEDFGVSIDGINITVTVFMAVFAFGPLFWASFADWKGRRPLYVISLSIFVMANVLLAAVPANFGALIFLRIIQAFGSAAVVSLGAGTVADITEPKRRASAMSLFLLGPQCGPIVGPVLGGLLAGFANWRWIFGFLAIAAAVLLLAILFLLPETLRSRVGNGQLYSTQPLLVFPPRLASVLAPEQERGPPPPKPTLLGYWKLFTYPPIGLVSFNTAILYASYFCIAIAMAVDLPEVYGWSTAATGGAYVAVGVAIVVGSLVGGRVSDFRRGRALANLEKTKLSEAENEKSKSPLLEIPPENRLVDQIWGVLMCAAGSAMYGWFVMHRIHPAGTLVSTFLVGFGMSWVFVTTSAFLTECVPRQAAAAFALGNLLRTPAAAIAAAIIHPLVVAMGSGWCFSGLAALQLVVVGSSVIILRQRGAAWRKAKESDSTANGKN